MVGTVLSPPQRYHPVLPFGLAYGPATTLLKLLPSLACSHLLLLLHPHTVPDCACRAGAVMSWRESSLGRWSAACTQDPQVLKCLAAITGRGWSLGNLALACAGHAEARVIAGLPAVAGHCRQAPQRPGSLSDACNATHNATAHTVPPACCPLPPSGRGGGVDLSALSIVAGKTCWVLWVDALLLNLGGNLHDALSVAAKVRSAAQRSCAGGRWLVACVGPVGRTGCAKRGCHKPAQHPKLLLPEHAWALLACITHLLYRLVGQTCCWQPCQHPAPLYWLSCLRCRRR